jgi:hypothetical protein
MIAILEDEKNERKINEKKKNDEACDGYENDETTHVQAVGGAITELIDISPFSLTNAYRRSHFWKWGLWKQLWHGRRSAVSKWPSPT